jgi:hypothetical protein
MSGDGWPSTPIASATGDKLSDGAKTWQRMNSVGEVKEVLLKRTHRQVMQLDGTLFV